MSHVSTTLVALDDLDALEAAAEELGLKLVRNQKTYKWYGSWVDDYHAPDAAYQHGVRPEDYGKCEHAIVDPNNPRAYEIGLVKIPDGYTESVTLADGRTVSVARKGWWPVMDFWAGGGGMVSKVGGNRMNSLMQGYSKHKLRAQAKLRGYVVVSESVVDGKVHMRLRR